jgi:hypothetical protein
LFSLLLQEQSVIHGINWIFVARLLEAAVSNTRSAHIQICTFLNLLSEAVARDLTTIVSVLITVKSDSLLVQDMSIEFIP